MQEIAALVAGVVGGESGSARIMLRGTSISATYYLDFEGTQAVSTGVDVVLDSSGSAVVYVNAVVTVEVRDSAGAVVRTFTAGEESSAVTYRGPSFTGANYATGAAAVSEPITLKSVLDLWTGSSSSTDFQVNANGTSQGLAAAINGLVGAAFNVKDPQFGAAGDGTTDDSTAIGLALTAASAAGGGTVFFPTGTYFCTGLTIASGVSLLGAGPGSTTLKSSATGTSLLTLSTSTTTQRVAGLTIGGGAAMSVNLIVLGASSRLFLDNCQVTQNTSSQLISQSGTPSNVRITNCLFTIGASVSNAGASIINTAGVAGSPGTSIVSNCIFTLPASLPAVNQSIVSLDSSTITGCVFDCSALATGGATINCIRAASVSAAGAVAGCIFTNGGGATIVGILLGTYGASMNVTESANCFGTSVTAYSYTNALAAAGAQVGLASREQRVQRITSNATAITVASDLFGVIYIQRSGVAALTISGPIAPEGSRLTIVVENKGGGASGTIVLSSTWFEAGGAGAVVSNNNFSIYRCRSATLAAAPLWCAENLRENVT